MRYFMYKRFVPEGKKREIRALQECTLDEAKSQIANCIDVFEDACDEEYVELFGGTTHPGVYRCTSDAEKIEEAVVYLHCKDKKHLLFPDLFEIKVYNYIGGTNPVFKGYEKIHLTGCWEDVPSYTEEEILALASSD